MGSKYDTDFDQTPVSRESERIDGCFPDGVDNTDCPATLKGKAKFVYEKREAALRKYADAVRLYATTEMSVRLIAKECRVSEGG